MTNTPAQAPAASPEPRKPRGRPVGTGKPLLPPERRKSATIHERMTADQKAKYLRLGAGDWLRRQIDRSRP